MRLLILVFFLVLFSSAWAQKPFVRDYSLTENNAGVKVNGLASDATGYIWLATDIGLIRFNGRTFLKIQDSVKKPVTAVAVVGRNIWVGYENGKIGVLDNLQVKVLPLAAGPSSSVSSLIVSNSGILVAGTEEQGVFVVFNRSVIPVNTGAGLADNFIYYLAVVGDNHILAASDMGVNDISLEHGRVNIKVYNTRTGMPDNIASVVRKGTGSDKFWIGMQEGGVATISARTGKVSPMHFRDPGWPYGQVNDILPVSDNSAWIATENGYLVEINSTDSNHYKINPYHYPGKSFKKLLQDRAGNIWCGTNRGLTLMTGAYISDIKLSPPYGLSSVSAMTWDGSNLVLALKKDIYKVKMDDSACRLEKFFSAAAPVTSLYHDSYGHIWAGTLGDGLYYQKAKASFVKVAGIGELGSDASILNISGTSDRIWLSGLKGVEELSYGAAGHLSLVMHHGKKTGIGSDYVYQLFPDRRGNIWMATDGAGVCMYDGRNYHHWDSAFEQDSRVAYSITEDIYGGIWAATMYKDLFQFDGRKWQNLRLSETQYPDINVSSVMANAAGQVISVYQRCIDVWYPSSRYFRHFNSALGIGIDSTSSVLNCMAKDSAGNIYVPYERGVIKFRNYTGPADIRPSVHITHPTVYSRPVSDNRREFEYDENYVGFAFEGVGYVNHERFNYRYTLQGYNDDWIYTNDAYASFPKLAPGTYTFRVQVSLNPSFEHPQEDEYTFSVSAPFWKTNLFYFLASIFVFASGYLYVKLREKRLKSISLLQQERMKFEYEHLKSQVNPHFLFNSLYALSILIEEKKENAVSYTVHLADLYRNMLAHNKKDFISLKEEFGILMSYIHIQQTRFGDALQLKVDIPDELMEQTRIVPLAMQLLVENAIKHNVVSMAQPLVIYISAVKNEIVVRNIINPKISKEKGAGIGLLNIRQRYSLLSDKPVTFGIVEDQFIVQLPLL